MLGGKPAARCPVHQCTHLGASPTRPDALTAGRILVVDDNQDAAESARMLEELSHRGVSRRVACPGDQKPSLPLNA